MASVPISYVYHYCAMYQDEPGSSTYIDGIMVSPFPINTHVQFREAKKVISEEHAEHLIVLSFTALPSE